MRGVHSHLASRCVWYLLVVHCTLVPEVRKKIETATASAMSRDDFNPAEMCFSLAFLCKHETNEAQSISSTLLRLWLALGQFEASAFCRRGWRGQVAQEL